MRPSRRPGRALPRSHVEGLLREDKRKAGRLFVATSDTRVIGFLACALESDVLELEALRVRITDLAVAATWRRRGVAAALIAAAEGFARGKGAVGGDHSLDAKYDRPPRLPGAAVSRVSRNVRATLDRKAATPIAIH